jgi:hypothetical protein
MKQIFTILKHSKPWSYLLIFLLLALSFNYGLQNEHSDAFWKWIDPVAGTMTFITSLAIFWFQAKEKWENSLEKLLSVDYIYTGGEHEMTIAKVQNAYLAGESDVRQWAQSLGQQIMGNLDFDMNWDEEPQKIDFDPFEGKYFKYYHVKLYITSDPRFIKNDDRKGEKVMRGFLERKFKYSTIEGNLEKLPILWKKNK